jgi:hypothetical protein
MPGADVLLSASATLEVVGAQACFARRTRAQVLHLGVPIEEDDPANDAQTSGRHNLPALL